MQQNYNPLFQTFSKRNPTSGSDLLNHHLNSDAKINFIVFINKTMKQIRKLLETILRFNSKSLVTLLILIYLGLGAKYIWDQICHSKLKSEISIELLEIEKDHKERMYEIERAFIIGKGNKSKCNSP